MEDKSVDELIQELKALQLREAEVLVLIEQANKQRDLVVDTAVIMNKRRRVFLRETHLK
jgi:hypothetical protein